LGDQEIEVRLWNMYGEAFLMKVAPLVAVRPEMRVFPFPFLDAGSTTVYQGGSIRDLSRVFRRTLRGT
jgi:hypothetical protein